MALRGVKPTTIQKRFKAFLFGPAGMGKTTAAIQFPKPYLIDTERGAENDQYTRLLDEAGGMYYHTPDFDELMKEVKSLLSEPHDFRTLVIDPLTVVYHDMLEKAERKVGTEHGRHYGEANKHVRHLLNLLFRLDMNVIITSHAKKEYGPGMVVLGNTFDCYNKLDYVFDLAIELQKRGKERVGVVRKTRIEAFPEGDVFTFSYDAVADRYGRDLLERSSVAETLASPDQVAELSRLVELLKVPAATTDKWLDKAMAASFAEMPCSTIQACIDHLRKSIAA
jgi:hypothetical protein